MALGIMSRHEIKVFDVKKPGMQYVMELVQVQPRLRWPTRDRVFQVVQQEHDTNHQLEGTPDKKRVYGVTTFRLTGSVAPAKTHFFSFDGLVMQPIVPPYA